MLLRRDNKDEKWIELKEQVRKRDKDCRLAKKLSAKDYLVLQKKAGRLLASLDCAHVFGAGPYPHLIYEKKNIVLLNRYSHRLLDEMKHPVYGTSITSEERREWWIKIVGKERYKCLEEMSRNGNH
jgi:hypothetical protein